MQKKELVKNLEIKLSKYLVTKKKNYKKGETITTYIGNRAHLFILLSGQADLEHYDATGVLSIIEHIAPYDIFGDQFHSFTSNELTVVTKKKAIVLAFDYNELTRRINGADAIEIYEMLFSLMSNKIETLNNRTALLTRRTIREKLLAYFHTANLRSNSSFTLPISYTELAEYLSVDRSAMMREISHLEDDGIIIKKGRELRLLHY